MTQQLQPPGPGLSTSVSLTLSNVARKQPRLFVARWDNSKTKTRDARKFDQQEAWGTHYPNGLVTLDTGSVFAMMGELRHTLEQKGPYEIVYLDEVEVSAGHGQ